VAIAIAVTIAVSVALDCIVLRSLVFSASYAPGDQGLGGGELDLALARVLVPKKSPTRSMTR
jgi:hypothetical protein